uniref:Disease resistance RPP13-like protein 4 n=1 Tax=Noccaea caerulescens TaxID=107243 RepID=A0A1J3J5A5_NOCCA
MASQNNPHAFEDSDDPKVLAQQVLEIVECLHKDLSSKDCERDVVLTSRSIDHEGSETNNPNDLSDVLPVSTHLYDSAPISSLIHHLRLLKERLINLEDLREYMGGEMRKHYCDIDLLFRKASFASQNINGVNKDVEGITRKISDLVGKVSSVPDKLSRQKVFHSQEEYNHNGDNNGRRCDHLPGIHTNVRDLTKSEAFRQVEQKFKELEMDRKICLLSFAVFPENREVHRTMLKYWWIGEGTLPVERAEETVREVLKEFTEKNLVEPVEERRKVAPSSYKMTSFVHSSVVHLSKEIGLFDIYHEGCKPSMNKSEMGKVCLVEGSSNEKEAGRAKMRPFMDIGTVFNVNERYPEFTFQWFLEYRPDNKYIILFHEPSFKSLHVFYLGRWERTQKRYIQVEDPKLILCLKFMKNLRVLSLQGISTITRLRSAYCKLPKLIVLDLRECSELAKLPGKIDSLQSLVYLDMTGCYMLEWIPMRLASLNNLEVLKGFVVSDTIYEGVACTLKLMRRLKKLRKLSIEIHRDDLGLQQLMVDLVQLKALTSLKVTWRRDLNIIRAAKPEDFTEIKSLPHQLKKLDLQRFPEEELPTWLQPRNLLHLKKLHIGGGRLLKDFGDFPEKATRSYVSRHSPG